MGEHYEGAISLTGAGNEPADDEDTQLGRHAYQAYCAATGGTSLATGVQLPSWDDQAPEIRGAWIMSARAVKNTLQS